MVSVGRDTSGSQFYIDLGVNKHFDGRCVVFGRLISGEPVLDAIEQVGAYAGSEIVKQYYIFVVTMSRFSQSEVCRPEIFR
jgi:cyclophilin family peptidyl-prolyl cis-trans isomerase